MIAIELSNHAFVTASKVHKQRLRNAVHKCRINFVTEAVGSDWL